MNGRAFLGFRLGSLPGLYWMVFCSAWAYESYELGLDWCWSFGSGQRLVGSACSSTGLELAYCRLWMYQLPFISNVGLVLHQSKFGNLFGLNTGASCLEINVAMS